MPRRREAPTQPTGPKRLLIASLLGIGLSAALLTSACGADATATAGKDKNPDKSTTSTRVCLTAHEESQIISEAITTIAR